MPSSRAASFRLGVSRLTCGSSTVRIRSKSLSFIRRLFVLAAITGSNTTKGGRWRASTSAIASAISALATMPIFTAATATSSNTASSCARTSSGVSGETTRTACVFCATTAVTTAMP